MLHELAVLDTLFDSLVPRIHSVIVAGFKSKSRRTNRAKIKPTQSRQEKVLGAASFSESVYANVDVRFSSHKYQRSD